MKRTAIVFAALTFAVLASGPAHAACKQADGAGTWRAFSTAVDNGDIWWLRCTIKLNAGGTIYLCSD